MLYWNSCAKAITSLKKILSKTLEEKLANLNPLYPSSFLPLQIVKQLTDDAPIVLCAYSNRLKFNRL